MSKEGCSMSDKMMKVNTYWIISQSFQLSQSLTTSIIVLLLPRRGFPSIILFPKQRPPNLISLQLYNIQMQINKNRQLITLQQTLAYIKYLNRQQPFDKDEIIIPTKDYQQITQANQHKVHTPKEKFKKAKIQNIDDEDLTKKINKNRAIKRIIQSAFQILQNFKNYEEEGQAKQGDKSSDIQFNIYLKQYNRVLEMIYNKEKERLTREAHNTQGQEELLQSIYEYTVVEDFREILPVAVLKDKISKNNVEIMIKALSDSLVVLRSNELRVYEGLTAFGSYKTIKLHEIQNVDYHTQPYIFIVLTIQKDKERFNIYLRFQSEKNQEKWDRALYCCYIGRKMKTKERFFLLQYPQEDVKKKEKEETKKLAAFHHDPDPQRKPLDRIFNQGKSMSISSKKEMEEQVASRSNTQGRKMSVSKSNINKNSGREQQPQEAFPIMERTASELGVKGTIRSKLTNNNQSQTIRNLDKQSPINRNKTDYIQINKSQQLIPPTQHDLTQRNAPPASFTQIDQENRSKVAELEHEVMPEDIRRIHDIERRNVKGIVLEKERFFFNKSKILYMKENRAKLEQQEGDLDLQSQYEAMRQREIEYWDFDAKSGEKTERKVIRLINVTVCEMREGKGLFIKHQSNKEIMFLGQANVLKELIEWINLIQSIYKTKLIPKQP